MIGIFPDWWQLMADIYDLFSWKKWICKSLVVLMKNNQDLTARIVLIFVLIQHETSGREDRCCIRNTRDRVVANHSSRSSKWPGGWRNSWYLARLNVRRVGTVLGTWHSRKRPVMKWVTHRMLTGKSAQKSEGYGMYRFSFQFSEIRWDEKLNQIEDLPMWVRYFGTTPVLLFVRLILKSIGHRKKQPRDFLCIPIKLWALKPRQ